MDNINQRYTKDLAAQLRQRQEEIILSETREMAAMLRMRQEDLFRRDQHSPSSAALAH